MMYPRGAWVLFGLFDMNDALRNSAQNLLGVTIAFTLGAGVITASLFGLSVLGISPDLGQGVEDWFQVAVLTVSLSAMAGLIIDALRLVSALVWRTEADLGSASPRS